MDQVLIEAAKQSPVLAVVIVLVWVFLNHVKEIQNASSLTQSQLLADAAEMQKRMMESHAKRTDEFISTVKEINAEQKDSRDQHTTILSSLVNEVTRLGERISGQHEKRH